MRNKYFIVGTVFRSRLKPTFFKAAPEPIVWSIGDETAAAFVRRLPAGFLGMQKIKVLLV